MRKGLRCKFFEDFIVNFCDRLKTRDFPFSGFAARSFYKNLKDRLAGVARLRPYVLSGIHLHKIHLPADQIGGGLRLAFVKAEVEASREMQGVRET